MDAMSSCPSKQKSCWLLRLQELSVVDVSRHISQEARVVLTSLRAGPPHVARGDLAQSLMDLRKRIEREMDGSALKDLRKLPSARSNAVSSIEQECFDSVIETQKVDDSSLSNTDVGNQELAHDVVSFNENGTDQQPTLPESSQKVNRHDGPNSQQSAVSVSVEPRPTPPNPYALPFLQIITDPRAAGPHTLATLRSVHRLLEQGTFRYFGVSSEEVTQSILGCKFEQTDAGVDEAVEMSIADVLSLIVQQDYGHIDFTDVERATQSVLKNINWNALGAFTLMDAFNTVFVTRKTFLHSPAMCYHFEDVLTTMIETVFRLHRQSARHLDAAQLIFGFLVNQLLHTPLVGGDGLDESTREAQMSHDDTRTLCLRLTRCALRVGWSEKIDESDKQNTPSISQTDTTEASKQANENESRTLIQIIQDDLCLSLLMTGQAIWAYHDTNSNSSPGFVSLEVLSEICSTLSSLWNTVTLRSQLISQFETILTGFYTRALVLLRKRKQPTNSLSFNSNLIFDAEVEIILESLVDLLCLHDQSRSIADGDGGSLETMFTYYDCNLRRSDVATGIMLELSRCCGGNVNEEGDAILSRGQSFSQGIELESESIMGDNETSSTTSGVRSSSQNNLESMVRVEHAYRQAPAHLKELCAQALMGGMKCLFRDDNPSAETLIARSKRGKSILLSQVESGLSLDGALDDVEKNSFQSHGLRQLKSKKRLMRKAAQVFNKNASKGIAYLLDSGLVTDPVSPSSVAAFLRNGIVVGLDKKQIGMYLGEAGKSPVAGKSPPCWERDWFHKDVLKIYCTLFRFENQSLLDGLRMFLAAFRLPGEAQQIDRILQAFADSCGQVCEESSIGKLKLFSDDPKRASDAAYLLSFSIIMLNTDRHNSNIKEDRKMSCEAFIKNNTDYGRDITEKGKELPPEYLASIYDSINEEEIRTEGEGAEGAMTVERWKDVLRGSTEAIDDNDKPASVRDAEDLTELILEHVWKPIMSAIGALWGAKTRRPPYHSESRNFGDSSKSGMLGVQGARLGMDLSLAMLSGVRKLGRADIYRKIFTWVCEFTGLLTTVSHNSSERGLSFIESMECQSAVIVAIRSSLDSWEVLDEDCWKRVWSIIFELRDLKLIPLGSKGHMPSLLLESDFDFLNMSARIEWNLCLVKGDMNYDASATKSKNRGRKVVSVLGAFGRALFGTGDSSSSKLEKNGEEAVQKSAHGKESFVLWNEGAPSDDECDVDDEMNTSDTTSLGCNSVGDLFESRLIRESLAMSRHVEMPVTGLERVEETRRYQISPRAQVRERLRSFLNLSALVTESRFMDEASFLVLLRSLTSSVSCSVNITGSEFAVSFPSDVRGDREISIGSASTTSFTAPNWNIVVSPASEALAEVLICEFTLKNKDRMKVLWDNVLQEHYFSRLTSILVNPSDIIPRTRIPVDPGLEKRISGLLRLSIYAIQRAELANEVLSSWKYLLPVNDEQHAASRLRLLDRHISEGLKRIVAQVDSIPNLNEDGWEGLVSILCWCAKRGGALKPLPLGGPSGLAEDDPALQCYRALHLLLNTPDLDHRIPCSIVTSLRSLVAAGGRRKYAQLSIACLDLLSILHEKKITTWQHTQYTDAGSKWSFWPTCWRKIVECITEAAELSTDTHIRQHALSILTDLFLDKEGIQIPLDPLCNALRDLCIPLAGRQISRFKLRDPSFTSSDDLMMEFELCIGLMFKPFRHYLRTIMETEESLISIWKLVLNVLEELMQDTENTDNYEEQREVIHGKIKLAMVKVAHQYLQNAIFVLSSEGVLKMESSVPDDITTLTWNWTRRMGISDNTIIEWGKQLSIDILPETAHASRDLSQS